jgi:hypothetical protein
MRVALCGIFRGHRERIPAGPKNVVSASSISTGRASPTRLGRQTARHTACFAYYCRFLRIEFGAAKRFAELALVS